MDVCMNDRFRNQLPSAVVMVRPAAFGFNPETAATNAFQKENTELSRKEIQYRARKEFDLMVHRLTDAGITVHVIEDTETPITPDAVFPNNWISFHHDGSVVLYPMYAPSRRLERRRDLIDRLGAEGYQISRVIDLSPHENEGRYLEGTGSIVFDHTEGCAYANISPRTHPDVFGELCALLGYSRITFRAVDGRGQSIYHTNVMMSLGSAFAIVCADSISDPVGRKLVLESLQMSGREIVTIGFDQLDRFAGNVLHVQSGEGSVLVMSTQACLAFTRSQRRTLEKYARIMETPIPLIEAVEGGSARCMLAGVHLPRLEFSPAKLQG
jgi:hypothetical protein